MIDDVAAHQKPRIRNEQVKNKREKHDKIMSLETYKEKDIKGKAIADVMTEMSPKYQRNM